MTKDCAFAWWMLYYQIFIDCDDRKSYRVRRALIHMERLWAIYAK